MATRGRNANHLHIIVAGDGQPHPIDHDTITNHSVIDILERVLNHDEQAASATTLARQATDPEKLLAPAVAKYSDALGIAAEHHLGPDTIQTLEDHADQLVLFITTEPAWPTLKTHLLQLATTGLDPIDVLRDAINQANLDDAHDVAALLDWRIDPTRHLPTGPLPWLPGIPTQLANNPTWGAYLTARANLVADLANQTLQFEPGPSPSRQHQTHPAVPDQLAGDLRLWRAANNVPANDLRPTGKPANTAAAIRWQHHLDHEVAATGMPDITPWWPQIKQLSPYLAADQDLPLLTAHLQKLTGAGIDAHAVLDAALHDGPLPAQGMAAALTWRLERHNPTRHRWQPINDPTPGPRRPPESIPGTQARPDRGIHI